MGHTYAALKSEYEANLARMTVRPERAAAVDQAARKLLAHYRAGRYGAVPVKTGIPVAWIAASFEREASSDFRCSPAQGDRWDIKSVNVPRGRGPFTSWEASALDAYHLDGLDKIGAGNWSWALACYYGELFNGFGYRNHAVPSPYLWGGSNIQKRGKYVRDGVFDPNVMDTQLGIIPIMKRMVEIEPSLKIAGQAATPAVPPPPREVPKQVPPKMLAVGGVVAAGGGLAVWFQDHWWVLAFIAVGAVIAVSLLLRKPAPPPAPKAI